MAETKAESLEQAQTGAGGAVAGSANAVETRGLTRRFGTLVAVDHLDIAFPHGSIFGLLGPNGAGKSTLIKMLTTLLAPSEGTAFVAGYDIVREPRQVRRKIGYVSQMLSADGDLTGYENLLISAKLYGISRAERKVRIARALEFMKLAHVKDKFVKHYSGGMIRRLEIAQSMLHHPAVLFLDEPTVGLDPIREARGVAGHSRPSARVRHHDHDDHARHARSRRTLRNDRVHAPGNARGDRFARRN